MKPLPHAYEITLTGASAGYATASAAGLPDLTTAPPAAQRRSCRGNATRHREGRIALPGVRIAQDPVRVQSTIRESAAAAYLRPKA